MRSGGGGRGLKGEASWSTGQKGRRTEGTAGHDLLGVAGRSGGRWLGCSRSDWEIVL